MGRPDADPGGSFSRHQPDGVPGPAASAAAVARQTGPSIRRRPTRAQRQPRHGDDMSDKLDHGPAAPGASVPETPAADDSDLFDRITALPQDAPVSERREGPTRRQPGPHPRPRRGHRGTAGLDGVRDLAVDRRRPRRASGHEAGVLRRAKAARAAPGRRLAEPRRRPRRQFRDDPRRRRRPGSPHRDERMGVLLGGRDRPRRRRRGATSAC